MKTTHISSWSDENLNGGKWNSNSSVCAENPEINARRTTLRETITLGYVAVAERRYYVPATHTIDPNFGLFEHKWDSLKWTMNPAPPKAAVVWYIYSSIDFLSSHRRIFALQKRADTAVEELRTLVTKCHPADAFPRNYLLAFVNLNRLTLQCRRQFDSFVVAAAWRAQTNQFWAYILFNDYKSRSKKWRFKLIYDFVRFVTSI